MVTSSITTRRLSQQDPAVSGRTSVLIVEDEGIVAMDLQQALSDLGYDVSTPVASGEEALRAATLRCPDIALMDIRIRGKMDGIGAASLLKERFGIPVIFLTAHSDDATLERAKQVEPHGYLVKPVKLAELKSAIEVSVYKHAMERNQRERERWFGTTLKAIADAVISVDLSGRVAFMNAAAEELTGVQSDKAVGLKAHEVLRLEQSDASVGDCTPLDLALEYRRTVEVANATLRRPDDTSRLIADSAAPVFDEERLLGAVMVFRDITEETRLRHQSELASRLASLGTMAAGVGHEINNPLTAVIANGSYMAEGLRKIARQVSKVNGLDSLVEQVEDLLSVQGEVAASTERIAKIVESLRDFSSPKVRHGQGDVLRAARWAIRTLSPETSTRAQVIDELTELPLVALDEVKLGQLFVNLIGNAAHAIPEGAADKNRIIVRAFLSEQKEVIAEVEDTGCGIPPEHLARIFDPFFTTKAVGEGTGLGLSIIHGILAAAGGSIGVSSQVGVGSVFRVVLPVLLSHLEDAPTSSAEARAMVPRGRVLVIDADPAVRRGLSRMLAGHEVTCVAKPDDALALMVSRAPFDVLVAEVSLGGVRLYESLLMNGPEEAARILFLCGVELTDELRGFLASVKNEVINKPLDAPLLVKRVNRSIATRRRGFVTQ